MKGLAILALAVALAGCGNRSMLEPPPGESLPVAPAAARVQPTADQLLTPTTEARPDRVDERLRRSEPRQDDHFDLPPPG